MKNGKSSSPRILTPGQQETPPRRLFQLRTGAHNRVMWPIINGRAATLALRHCHPGCCGCGISGSVNNPEGNRVNTTVTATRTLSPQLNRAAARSNHDVTQRVSIASAVHRLIASHLRDNHCAYPQACGAAVCHACYKVGYSEGLVLVIWRPHRGRPAV